MMMMMMMMMIMMLLVVAAGVVEQPMCEREHEKQHVRILMLARIQSRFGVQVRHVVRMILLLLQSGSARQVEYELRAAADAVAAVARIILTMRPYNRQDHEEQ